MKFKQFINESDDRSYTIIAIEKECQPFIKAIRGASGFLYRNDGYGSKGPGYKKKVRSDRRPMDSPIEIHEFVDEQFKKRFGWKGRSEGLFVWGANRFSGKVDNPNFFTVFPVGNFKFIWSPVVSDLYGDLVPFTDEFDGFLENWNKVNKSYTDKNLKKAVTSNNEIMIGCKEAWIIRRESLPTLNKELNLKLKWL